MERTFRAEKMIARVKEEGRGDMLDEKTLSFIKSLDGEKANDYNWESVVNGSPLAWIKKTDKHEGAYVNIADCD